MIAPVVKILSFLDAFHYFYMACVVPTGKQGWLACRSSGAGRRIPQENGRTGRYTAKHIGVQWINVPTARERSPGTADVPFGCQQLLRSMLQRCGVVVKLPHLNKCRSLHPSGVAIAFAASLSPSSACAVPSGCVPWPSIRSPTSSSPEYNRATFRGFLVGRVLHRQHDLEGHTAAARSAGRLLPHPPSLASRKGVDPNRRIYRRGKVLAEIITYDVPHLVRGAGRGSCPDAGTPGAHRRWLQHGPQPGAPETLAGSSGSEVIEVPGRLASPQAAQGVVVHGRAKVTDGSC